MIDKKIMITEPNHKKAAALRASLAGFILLDSSLNLIYSNPEAVKILAYPKRPKSLNHLANYLPRIHTELINRGPLPQSALVSEFESGKRRYLCWAFSINSPSNTSFHPTVALLLIRSRREFIDISKMAEQFRLTKREREVVEFLIQGLSGKEIGNRLKISPNTVKVFLRLVMIKMGVSTRSGILGKFIKAHISNEQASSLFSGSSP